MKKNKKAYVAAILICALCVSIFAQTDDDLFSGSDDDAIFIQDESFSSDDSFFSDDNLFSDDDLFSDEVIIDNDVSTAGTEPVSLSGSSLIFQTGSVRFGGSLSSSIQLNTVFMDPYNEEVVNAQYFGDSLKNKLLIPSIGVDLFFDARPKDALRLYGKFKILHPFETELPLGVLTMGALPSVSIPSFKVAELFTDFEYKDRAFFRFGKHTVKWGVGYFFSPADIINLSKIDPENPDEQREGPVSLRTQIIVPGTQTNVWVYMLPDTKTYKAIDTAAAAKAEFVLGSYEMGIGAWYKYNRPPHAVATFTGSIAGKVGVFAEGVFAWGSEADWLTRSSDDLEENDTAVKDMKPVFKATIGASYYWKLPKLNLAAQYAYDESHTAALSISRSEFISKKLSLSGFGMMDLVDLTGMASATLGISCFDGLSISTGPSFTFGTEEKLGSPQSISYSITARLGGGRF